MTQSVGLTSRMVQVQAISPDGTQAMCADRYGYQASVPMFNQRAKGRLPQAGDVWLIGQDTGQWTFQQFIGAKATDFLIQPGDIAPGVVPQLDTVAADIQPVGIAALAGATGKAADAGHVHPVLSASYTPVWSGLSALGTSVPTGRYVLQGGLCTVWASLVAAGSTSLGNAVISCSLPFTAADYGPVYIGTGIFEPHSGTDAAYKLLHLFVDPGGTVMSVYTLKGATAYDIDTPGNQGFSWVGSSSSQMSVQLTYLVA